MLAYVFQGRRYDVGFLEAAVEFALQRDNLKEDFLDDLAAIAAQYQGGGSGL